MARAAGDLWEPPESVGERVFYLRSKRGMSQRALVELVLAWGVSLSVPNLSKIENGRRRPTQDQLVAIARALSTEGRRVALSDLGVTEKDYPQLALYRDPATMEHIRCSVRRRRGLGGRQAPLLVVARSEA